MGAVWFRARAEMRTRWRSLFSAALLCGLFGAAVLATFAGARRTEAAYPSFLERNRAYDVLISDTSAFADVFWKPDFDALARLPYVDSAVRLLFASFGGVQADTLFIGSSDPRWGRTINRAVVIQGRLPDQTRADEVAIPYFADKPLSSIPIGGHITIKRESETINLKVVGRTVMPGEVPPRPQFGWPVFVTKAFVERYEKNAEFTLQSVVLRFKDRSDIARFERDVAGLTNGKVISPQEQESHARAVEGSAGLYAAALRLLALFTALTGAMILGQLLARETAIGSEEASILSALGLDQRELFRLGIIRMVPVAIGGSFLAVLIAWLASPLFPRGSVRVVEPSHGPVFDTLVLGTGGVAIAAVVMLLVLLPAWRASTTAGRKESPPARPSGVASILAAAGMSVPAVAGSRLALERGRGRTSVPVVSSLVVIALGIASFVASTTFAGSLHTMVNRSVLHGKTWDTVVDTANFEIAATETDPRSAEAGAALAADPDVEAIGFADSGIPMRLFAPLGPDRGIPVLGLAVMNLKGSVFSPIVEGRAPRAPDEVVLGTRMIRALRVRLDPLHPPTVEIGLQGGAGRRAPFRVVGRGVIPPLGGFGELGYGVMLRSEDALKPLLSDPSLIPPVTALLVRWRTGVEPEAVIARHRKQFPQLAIGEELSGGRRFAEAASFGEVEGASRVVGGVLAALGAAALAHVLITGIRRRRRDVAILKTVGFMRGQARRVVAWQATITVVVATLIGVPLGVIGGRWLWVRVANGLGVLPSPQVAPVVILILVPAVILLANLIAAFPARSAARTPPALVLRTE